VSFFLHLHRSITDPAFYGEVDGFSRGQPLRHILLLWLIAAFTVFVFHTYEALFKESGLAAAISTLLLDVRVVNGELETSRPVPYFPGKSSLGRVTDLIGGLLGGGEADSILIVDTAAAAQPCGKRDFRILMGKKHIEYCLGGMQWKSSYAEIFGSDQRVEFTPQIIEKYLAANRGSIMFFFLLEDAVAMMGIMLLSVIFLAFAACIFHLSAAKSVRSCFRQACYAVGPVAVGYILAAVAGTRPKILWYTVMLLSFFIIMRGSLRAQLRSKS
jgi:hypothetical protein